MDFSDITSQIGGNYLDPTRNPFIAADPGSTMIKNYYDRETGQIDEAKRRSQPSPEEEALMKQQVESLQKAGRDYVNTRKLIMAEMGITKNPDGSYRRMTQQEQEATMGELSRIKSDLSKTYLEKGQTAREGKTQLPSFLKVDIDHDTAKKEAMYQDLLGKDYKNSTIYKNAISQNAKQGEILRSQVQAQDEAGATDRGLALAGGLNAERGNRIAGLSQIPNQGMGLLQSRANIINKMQADRISELNKELARIDRRRADVTAMLSLGGTLGGGAASYYGGQKTQPVQQQYTSTPSAFGSFDFDPNNRTA